MNRGWIEGRTFLDTREINLLTLSIISARWLGCPPLLSLHCALLFHVILLVVRHKRFQCRTVWLQVMFNVLYTLFRKELLAMTYQLHISLCVDSTIKRIRKMSFLSFRPCHSVRIFPVEKLLHVETPAFIVITAIKFFRFIVPLKILHTTSQATRFFFCEYSQCRLGSKVCGKEYACMF